MPQFTTLPVRRTGRVTSVRPVRENFRVLGDKELRENIEALNRSREELDGINKLIRKGLGLPVDRKRSILANILHALIPSRFYESLPDGVLQLIAEEYDVLELIERLKRTNIDNVQDALRNLAACVIEKRAELDELGADLEEAETRGWDARELQQYIAGKSGIQIYDVVDQILDSEFKGLSEAEKERRKLDLLSELRSNIVIGEELMETGGEMCSAVLQVFHKAVGQYHAYIRFYRPVAVIRDAARILTDTNHSMYAARDALEFTFEKSLEAIELAVDAAVMVGNYSIASGDMKGLLEAGRKRLHDKLRALEAANAKSAVRQLKPVVAGDVESAIAGGG